MKASKFISQTGGPARQLANSDVVRRQLVDSLPKELSAIAYLLSSFMHKAPK